MQQNSEIAKDQTSCNRYYGKYGKGYNKLIKIKIIFSRLPINYTRKTFRKPIFKRDAVYFITFSSDKFSKLKREFVFSRSI